jgi:plasmid replication initiation protein
MENSKQITKSHKVLEASYRLTLNEQRLVLLALTKVDPKNDKIDENGLTKEIKIHAKDFAKQFGLKESSKQLIAAIDHLFDRSVTLIDNDEKVLKTRFITDASAYSDGAVSFTFAPKIAPYLFELGNRFKSYNIDEISKMNSHYSIRFYELFKQREDFYKRKLMLDELRELFDLDKKKYPVTSDFKKRVLERAIGEINKHTDLEIKIIRVIKPSRKIEGWEFSITKNKKRIEEEKKKKEERLKKQEEKDKEAAKKSNQIHLQKMKETIDKNKKQDLSYLDELKEIYK